MQDKTKEELKEEERLKERKLVEDCYVVEAKRILSILKDDIDYLEKHWTKEPVPWFNYIAEGDSFIYILKRFKKEWNEELDLSIEKVARVVFTKKNWRRGVAEKKLNELGLTLEKTPRVASKPKQKVAAEQLTIEL